MLVHKETSEKLSRVSNHFMCRPRGSIRPQGGLRGTRNWPFKIDVIRLAISVFLLTFHSARPILMRTLGKQCDYRTSICQGDFSAVSPEPRASSWRFIKPNAAKVRAAVPSNTTYLLNHSVSCATQCLHTNVTIISIF